MSVALDAHIGAFKSAMAAIKVARRVLDQRDRPLSNTGLDGISPNEAHALLDQAEAQLNQLVSFALFAAFERLLRDRLEENLELLGESSTSPLELAGQLQEFLQESVDNWRVDQVIELFSPPATPQDINQAKGIRTYRHHIAHGAAPPVSIPPRIVYDQLSQFLVNAGLAVPDADR